MDSDCVGGEEDGGGRRDNVVDVEEDDEARMDLTDDLLHKVRCTVLGVIQMARTQVEAL